MQSLDFSIPLAPLFEAFGPNALAIIAKDMGRREMVENPDYVPAVGSEMILDPNWIPTGDVSPVEDEIPLILNPDYVPAVGDSTMPNPVTPEQYLEGLATTIGARIILEKLSEKTKTRLVNEATQAAVKPLVETMEAMVAGTSATIIE